MTTHILSPTFFMLLSRKEIILFYLSTKIYNVYVFSIQLLYRKQYPEYFFKNIL